MRVLTIQVVITVKAWLSSLVRSTLRPLFVEAPPVRYGIPDEVTSAINILVNNSSMNRTVWPSG